MLVNYDKYFNRKKEVYGHGLCGHIKSLCKEKHGITFSPSYKGRKITELF